VAAHDHSRLAAVRILDAGAREVQQEYDRVVATGSAPPEVASGHDVLRELGVLFTGQTTAQSCNIFGKFEFVVPVDHADFSCFCSTGLINALRFSENSLQMRAICRARMRPILVSE